ncbi:hypothetical protein Sta7437_0957 [Stanieria cyanosphaera PCC 7437]|uniref:Uncharacterized protein n=1 Tax=Stanieria cyanosphaera (strain ATCC 29371 / PCC 7437) TaxID=111780 RepID=K9XR24_STAC7|nr:hypothetical protein [Stanieria cyanosphaera]AFZ34539.1 hypothetical protein Sta7437_0957 [Stanieria cyanosphaera PCC 7437]
MTFVSYWTRFEAQKGQSPQLFLVGKQSINQLLGLANNQVCV